MKHLALSATILGALIATTPVSAQEYVIRLSHGVPETMQDGQHAWATVFKEFVESATGGDIEVRILGANSAGSERQQLERVQTGINQMLLVSEITMPSFFEPAQVFGIPYLFPSSVVAWDVMDGEFGEQFGEAWREATGIRIIGGIESGFRSFFNSERPVHSPADLAGLRIRTGENPVHMAMVEALGASPTPIAWAEVYTSLQQGVVDGMENPPGLFYSMRFFEHQDYLTVDRHLYSFHFAMINDDFYQSLPEDYQAIVTEASALADTVGRSVAFLAERRALEDLREAGIEVYFPTAEEYAEFRDLARPAGEALVREQIGDEWVDSILGAIDATQASYANP